MFAEDEAIVGKKNATQTLAFRRYCFKKSEIFETVINKDVNELASRESRVLGSMGLLVIESIVLDVLNQIR